MLCDRCGSVIGVTATSCPGCGMSLADTQPLSAQAAGQSLPASYPGGAPARPPATSVPTAPTPPRSFNPAMMSSDTYYLSINEQQAGPYTVAQMKTMWQTGTINAGTHYWQTGMTDWQPLANIRHFLDVQSAQPMGSQVVVNQVNQVNQALPYQPIIVQTAKSRATYIVLGFFFGCLGVHNFYAGYSGRGVAQLLITITTGWFFGVGFFVTAVWAIVEIIAVNTDARGIRMA